MKTRNKIFLAGMFLFVTMQLPAEHFHREIPQYVNANQSINQIVVPSGDSSRLNVVFQKIDSVFALGRGRVNIVHIGGSHVQAGHFTDRIRQNLDEINNGLQPPRGYIFPYSVAKTNNPLSYSVSYTGQWEGVRNVNRNRQIPLGMGGIAAYTSDSSASVSVCLNVDRFDVRWNFDRLTVLGQTDDGSRAVCPVLTGVGDTVIRAVYDSLANVYRFRIPYLSDTFTVAFEQTDTAPHTFVLQGFLPETDEAGVVYHAIGVNGASVPSYIECEHFADELSLIAPDLVVFGIGINDAAGGNFTEQGFISHYNTLIENILRVNPDCAFIFITNNDSFRRTGRRRYAVNPRGQTARDAFYKLARQYSGGVWDLFTIMGGLGSMKTWETQGLAQRDKVHFTREGYQLLGDLFYNALMDY
jgi:lysophospholipase L1-like esterase